MNNFKPKTYEDLREELREEDPIEYNRLELGGKITAIRYRKGISQESLSTLSGVDKKTISRMENGKDETSFETIVSLADALGYELVLKEKDSLD